MAAPRNLTPIMQRIRDLMLQRPLKNNNRFEQLMSPRSQPPPNIPGGPSHQLSANYYYTRDGRRESHPPTVAYDAGRKALEAGQTTEGTAVTTKKPPIPGFGYSFETGKSVFN